MVASPRIVTVDPTGSLAQIVQAVASLLDQPITLIDVPGGQDALAEVKAARCAVLITTVELDDDMRGYQLAIQVSQSSPETHVVVLAESSDPELDPEELGAESPFIYMHRPVDLSQFARVMTAALNGGDIFAALAAPQATGGVAAVDMGQLPVVNVETTRPIVDDLLTDVGAMAIVFAARTGEVLLERGAVGYLDREKLTDALQPMFGTTIDMGELVGGQTRTLHFYDGDEYDVFVISVGLHHFLCLVFNGEAGNRAFGSVNRFGRRAAEDLAAIIGASAFLVERPPVEDEKPRRRRQQPEVETEEVFQPLERAEATYEEPEPLQLAPIEDLDLSIFDDLEQMDMGDADDLFDPEKLADLAKDENRIGGPIGFDEAEGLGILGKMD